MPSPGESMTGEERFLRVGTAVTRIGRQAMQDHLLKVFPNISDELSNQRTRLLSLHLQGAINEEQWTALYGADSHTPAKTVDEMNISLLAIIMNYLTPPADGARLDNLSAEGIRRIRNYLGRLPIASLQVDKYEDNMCYLEQYAIALVGPSVKARLEELAESDIAPADQIQQEAKAMRKEFVRQTKQDVPSNFSPVTEGQFFLHN